VGDQRVSYVQHIDHCTAHRGCVVISCLLIAQDRADSEERHYLPGQVVWASHLDSAIHASHRINSDVPAFDVREGGKVTGYMPPCPACASRLRSG
jgi:hypothetical protein